MFAVKLTEIPGNGGDQINSIVGVPPLEQRTLTSKVRVPPCATYASVGVTVRPQRTAPWFGSLAFARHCTFVTAPAVTRVTRTSKLSTRVFRDKSTHLCDSVTPIIMHTCFSS